MSSGRKERDVYFCVVCEDIIMGVASDKKACAIHHRGSKVLNVDTLTVGVDESGDGWPVPWAAWEAPDPFDFRLRTYSGLIEPAQLAHKIITANDGGDRKRLLNSWPAGGVEFKIVDIRSRYKQPSSNAVKSGDDSQTVRTRNPNPRPRAPRRTMRRYASTT